MQLINIGYGNMLCADRMVAVVSPEAAPVKRLVSRAKTDGVLIDASCGRKTKSVIVTDSGHVVLSAIHPETIANRVKGVETGKTEEEEDEES